MKTVKYLNLTSGLEYIDEISDYKLIRIQSSLCESKCWDKLIAELDYNFLFDLAQGNIVEVYDTSSKKKTSKAIYQGLEFIKYTLNKKWFNKEIEAYVRGMKVTDYFRQEYRKLSKNTLKKLDYVKKFINTQTINLKGYCKKSLHDGDYEYYKVLLSDKGK